MKLAEFFKSDLPPETNTQSIVMKPKLSNVMEQKTQMNFASEPRKDPIQMKINIKVEKPDIILVEHMKDVNTDALILNVSWVLQVFHKQTNT